jgi:mRNA interferase MazF
MVKINPHANNGLSKDSAADTFQIRSISTNRFIRKMGVIEYEQLNQIVRSIMLVVEYPLNN